MKETMSGTVYETGDIVLVPFPFSSDLDKQKQRPAMVVSSSSYNAGTKDLIVVGITTNRDNIGFHVPITQKNMESGNMPFSSLIKFGNIYTISKYLVIKKLGKADKQTVSKVMDGLRTVLNLV
jgi:mRNA-degrading endonuclease toxin of MazEF toxin-antitoxin module